VLELNQSNDP
jgi:hypothetical protein